MIEKLKQLLSPPVYEDVDKNARAQLLNTILLSLIFLVTLLWIVRLATGAAQLTSGLGLILPMGVLLLIGVYVITRYRYLEFGVYALLVTIWSVITLLNWSADGVKDSAFMGYLLVILVASLLSGWRLALTFVGLTIAAGWGLVYAETIGLRVSPEFDPASELMTDYTFILGLTGIMVYLLVSNLQQALESARKSNQELTALSKDLDQRVQERTRDLALAAEVGRRISRVQDLDKLLAESADLIRERFALYHVQIYLADAAGQNLNLRASTGGAGEKLLEQGHRLPIRWGSINGTAAFDQKPVLVPDTSINPVFHKNRWLPYTRSEMAVPLLMGEHLLGVLDLQSDRTNALSEENLPIFESLAAQLAVAINNAYLLRQAEQAQAEVKRYAQLAIHEGWEEFLDGVERKEKIGFRYDLDAVEAYDGPVVAIPGNKILQVPITVADTEIGTIQLLADEDSAWTEETQAVVTAVARQVGQQAENLRLLSETERYRAEAELAARRLSREAWNEFLRDKQDELTGFVYTGNEVMPWLEDDLEEHADEACIKETLKVHNDAIGELLVRGANSDEAQALLDVISNQLSKHIENLRLAEQTESTLAQTETLYQIGHALNAALNVEDMLHAALGPIFWTGIAEATLMFIEVDEEEEPKTLEILSGWRRDGTLSFPIGTIFPIKRFPFTSLFIMDPFDPQLIGDVTTDERVDDFTRSMMAQAGIRSIAVVPLTVGGQWVGLITCSWPEPRNFTRQEEEIFNALINMTAPAVQSQRLHLKTKAQADKEHLINAINQRIQSTFTVESALQTAVTELGQALKLKEAIVELSTARQALPSENKASIEFEENGFQN